MRMDSVIVPIGLGIFISILGIFNMRGQISSIHWYHRRRVTEENIRPFGKMVGLGTIIIGVSVTLAGVLNLAAELMKNDLFAVAGEVLVVMGLAVGLGVSFYAMIKYNKGIF